MIGSRSRHLRRGIALNENLPLIVGHLQLIQVESGQVIHEEAFYLTAENVDLRPKDIKGMAITSGRPWTGR